MFLKRKNDRRRGKRQLLNTSVRIFTDSTCLEALGINISEYGMRLFTVANLPVNSPVEIEFLPPRSKERVRVSGRVRHRALYLYGIEFSRDPDRLSRHWEHANTIAEQPMPR